MKIKESDELSQIIEERIYPVKYQMTTAINVNNGILNDQMLERAKRAFVMETVGVWKDEIVKTAQGYPADDVSDVIFDIDVVVMKTEDFLKIKELVDEQLPQEGSSEDEG